MDWIRNLLGKGKQGERPLAADGYIHIACACGKTLKVTPGSRGKTAKCKKCLRVHTV